MEDRVCEQCKYFFQHYVLLRGGYEKAGCGHCIIDRVKRRKPEERVCSRFVEKRTQKL